MKSADIRNGEYLEKAKETTVEDFFEKRMQNKIKKVQGANWEILFESNAYTYYGYPVIALFREGTFLEEFYKVDRATLESKFPSYKKFDGIEMKKICKDALGEIRKTNASTLSHSFECSASLVEVKVILVNGIILYRYEDGTTKSEKYLIRFDKLNLKKESIVRVDR